MVYCKLTLWNHICSWKPMIEDCQRLAGLREQNFTGNWFARQFITLLNIGGKGTPRNPQTSNPHEQ